MKLNLLLNNPYLVSGYINVDPYPADSKIFSANENNKTGDVNNLDWLVDDGECEEIIINDVLDYIDISEKQLIITNWVKKLSHNGKIIITGTDVYEACKAYIGGHLDLSTMWNFLYGPPQFAFGHKKGTMSIPELSKIFSQLGLKIIQKRSDAFVLSVVGQRL